MKVEKNRRDPVISTEFSTQVLPEYYIEDNSTLVTFLEKYNQFLDSAEGDNNFHHQTQALFASRDAAEVDLSLLDEIIGEIGSGLTRIL